MSAEIDKRAKEKGPTACEKKKESTRNKTQKAQKVKVKTCKISHPPSKVYADTIKQGRLGISGS